ncbi:MAG TPA: prolyl oligopeptidase family serine peptidase [Candidatus Binataceae bacterium]|jgi:predicted esterase|nr:prolyl oligopeptidase family serine peptidase [Candidatus Binataceae bacterium]
MASDDGDYGKALASFERDLLTYLRTLEEIQENLRLHEVRSSQARLVEATGATFRRFNAEFVERMPPAELSEFHREFVVAVAQLERSFNLFLTEPSPNWTLAFMHSRNAFVRGLYSLYELRDRLPTLSAYFLIEGATPPVAANGDSVKRGFSHFERTNERGQYTLYVPENYVSDRPWPLIICLHGGYGQGFEYIWTWLRSARSRGYILLAPKSIAETWTMTMGSVDTRSVMKMLDEVAAAYNVDRSRIYLTGLSDGGIFTYIMGLERHELFAGISPVAGALHMAADPMLRTGTGREVPIFVIHGVHDFIFPVTYTRQTNELLTSLNYNLKYEELPDWGHAFPYSINEQLVLPWFESLPPRAG